MSISVLVWRETMITDEMISEQAEYQSKGLMQIAASWLVLAAIFGLVTLF
jgi:hypothetical protein